MYCQFFKRFIDVILSIIVLLILGIPMLFVLVAILIEMGSPAFFCQRRIGKGNKAFKMWKFRSMSNARDKNGVFLPDNERITKVGAFIRKTSIDEFPSLINIVKGDMAIIGPRPLPVRYLNRFTKVQLRRHEVRPGLSNPSTINGRNNQTWEQQFEGDVWYVDHVSFMTDIKCIWDTIKVVLSHEGATAEDGGARGEFIGKASIEELQTDAEGNYMKL